MTDEFQPCEKSPDGQHGCCWHDNLDEKPFMNPFMEEICCHCGTVRSKTRPGEAIRDHGPFTPEVQIETVFKKEMLLYWRQRRTDKQRRDEEHVNRRNKAR